MESEEAKTGIVYILSNPKMPNLVKIGTTTRSIEERLRELFGTRTSGVPVPFVCEAAWEFDKNARSAEQALHRAFADRRVHASREFFEVPIDQPLAILERFGDRDVTPQDDVVGEQDPDEDRASLDRARKKREKFRFDMIGIDEGTPLSSIWDDEVKCEVAPENRVLFRGKEMSLSAAALKVSCEKGKKSRAVSGPDSWKYNGETLAAIRLRYELDL